MMLGQTQSQTQSIPDAPAPQKLTISQQAPSSLPDSPAAQSGAQSGASSSTLDGLKQTVAPGKGTSPDSNNEDLNPAAAAQKPATPPARKADDQSPPEQPIPADVVGYLQRVTVNFVEVPVTVKDKKGQLVPGLTWRDFKVFENNQRQDVRLFTVDPFPLSVALVIDQSVKQDTMRKVNQSLAALQGAFTPYDEIAIFTYNSYTKEQTGFTGAQSARVPAVIEAMKTAGRDMQVPVDSGPLASPGIIQNGQDFEHNITMHPSSSGGHITIPKEVHPLNDAILAAAQLTAGQPKGSRRIVYVISDGKEAGSKASFTEVKRYLETNKIAVYATLVGDSATFGLGFLDRIHLPLLPQDNILPKYTVATGGQLDSEFQQNGIEKSFAHIAEEVRTQYTLGYYSHEPVLDGKFRKIEVQVLRSGLSVYAKEGYYPSASDLK